MSIRTFLRAAALLGIPSLGLPLLPAQVVTYTDHSLFTTAISSGFNPAQVTDFESFVSTLVPSGGAVQGTTFTYNLGNDAFGNPISLQIGDTFPTTSPTHYLGTTADDAFLSGDLFTMTFASPKQAVGLYVISAGSNVAGDYTLTVPQGSALSSGAVDPAFAAWPASSGYVYFLGLVEANPADSFTSVTFSSVSGLGIPFNVDDIERASVQSGTVPDETSTGLLLLGAVAALLLLRRRRIRAARVFVPLW